MSYLKAVKKVDPAKIENSQSVKRSGVTTDSIDSELSFEKHIINICGKTKVIMNINNLS